MYKYLAINAMNAAKTSSDAHHIFQENATVNAGHAKFQACVTKYGRNAATKSPIIATPAIIAASINKLVIITLNMFEDFIFCFFPNSGLVDRQFCFGKPQQIIGVETVSSCSIHEQ